MKKSKYIAKIEAVKSGARPHKNKIIDEIYSSYDLSLNIKYRVKVFENTLDRIKNNFK